MKPTYNIILRILDIFISALAILMLLPVFLVVIFILRFSGERNIFYLQERVGFNMKPFFVFKFATMLKNSPNIATGAITLRNDPRVLPFGKILRKTKINELPQLFNILKGDMSFVGPRPLMDKQFRFYDSESQKIISQMKPGLTGVASIIFRDEERYFNGSDNPDIIYRTKIAPAKALLERWFFENMSLRLYFKIFFITVMAVLSPHKNFNSFLDDETRVELENVLR
jgi:lipopolysaccharide/colanic/teichoic acid biosynthesis glycosyltransferase